MSEPKLTIMRVYASDEVGKLSTFIPDGRAPVLLTKHETLPGYFDWHWPDGSTLAHNVPLGDSPRLPPHWKWVDNCLVEKQNG